MLSVLAKALETLIVKRLEAETGLNEKIKEQHGFTVGRSTNSALTDLLSWADKCPNRHVLGLFLDITGAFDHVRWGPIMNQIKKMNAKGRTMEILKSYLTNRQLNITIEGTTRTRTLTTGCPQGSQLGPTLWKVATARLAEIPFEKGIKWTFYADDITILAGAARKETAIAKLSRAYDQAASWAHEFGLTFSPEKSQTMSVKGGLKPNYEIRLGNDVVRACSPVKYLGVQLDYKRTYWQHIIGLTGKSSDLYSRLRGMMSAEWGLSQATARAIYRCVFLPRITYAAETWAKGLETKKAKTKLGSMQRRALLAVTGGYRTTSTSALQAIAGLLPLDLEIKNEIGKRECRRGLISPQEYTKKRDCLITEWEERWKEEPKGEWTKKMIPSVRSRIEIPMEVDHYVSQILSGHGDFRGKLHQFKLVNSPNCSCGCGSETVYHVLNNCKNNATERDRLKDVLSRSGEAWPPADGVFLKSRANYEALRKFARESLIKKRLENN